MIKFVILEEQKYKLHIEVECPMCLGTDDMWVPLSEFQLWCEVNGEGPVEDLFPRLSPARRERLVSGCCRRCWAELFPSERTSPK